MELNTKIEINDWITYHGNSRPSLYGSRFKVVKVTENGESAAFDAGIFGIQWCNVGKLEKVNGPVAMDALDSLDKTFTDAAGGTRAVLVAEIERTESRLAELRKALEVIDSL